MHHQKDYRKTLSNHVITPLTIDIELKIGRVVSNHS